MQLIVVQNPKGLWNIWSSTIDGWAAIDLTENQVQEWYAILAKEAAKEQIEALKTGKNPYGEYYLSYDDCERIRKEFGFEDDPPVVNPQFSYS